MQISFFFFFLICMCLFARIWPKKKYLEKWKFYAKLQLSSPYSTYLYTFFILDGCLHKLTQTKQKSTLNEKNLCYTLQSSSSSWRLFTKKTHKGWWWWCLGNKKKVEAILFVVKHFESFLRAFLNKSPWSLSFNLRHLLVKFEVK